MNNQLCIICFVTPVVKNVSLKCKFQVCAPCLVNWIEAKVGVEFIPSVGNKFQKTTELNSHIPCINYQCNESNHEDMEKGKLVHDLTYEECFEFLKGSGDLQSLERFSMIMLNIVAVNGLDYRKCPKRDCNYIGIVDLKPCNEPLECNQCGYSWEDPALYPFIKRTCRKLQNLCSIESEMLNDMQKVIRGEPCPNCGICIIKMSGCNHMVCSKCSYEFCWACLGHYPGYVHTESTYCPFRHVLIYYFVFFFLFISINEKLRLLFPTFRSIEDDIFDWFFYLIISNTYACFSMLWFAAISEMNFNYNLMNMYPEYSEIYRRGFKIALVVVILFPIFYIGLSAFLYVNSEYFRSMLYCLFIEFCIAVVVLFVILIFVLFNWCCRRNSSYQEADPYLFDQKPYYNQDEERLLYNPQVEDIHAPLLTEEYKDDRMIYENEVEMNSYPRTLVSDQMIPKGNVD